MLPPSSWRLRLSPPYMLSLPMQAVRRREQTRAHIRTVYDQGADPAREGEDDRWLLSTTIISTDVTDPAAAAIHDRTPVLLPPDRIDRWLDPSITDRDQVDQILAGIELAPLRVRQVPTTVNRVSEDGPQLGEPAAGTVVRPLQLTLAA